MMLKFTFSHLNCATIMRTYLYIAFLVTGGATGPIVGTIFSTVMGFKFSHFRNALFM